MLNFDEGRLEWYRLDDFNCIINYLLSQVHMYDMCETHSHWLTIPLAQLKSHGGGGQEKAMRPAATCRSGHCAAAAASPTAHRSCSRAPWGSYYCLLGCCSVTNAAPRHSSSPPFRAAAWAASGAAKCVAAPLTESYAPIIRCIENFSVTRWTAPIDGHISWNLVNNFNTFWIHFAYCYSQPKLYEISNTPKQFLTLSFYSKICRIFIKNTTGNKRISNQIHMCQAIYYLTASKKYLHMFSQNWHMP